MSLAPVGSYRKTRGIHRIGTRAAQPAANTCLEGTLYYVTDEKILERSTGLLNTWVPYSDVANIPQIQSDWNAIAGLGEILNKPIIDDWINIPHNAANFTMNGTSTWTVAAGDQTDFSYTIHHTTAILNFRLETTTIVTGTGDRLKIALPAAITPLKSIAGLMLISVNGTIGPGFFSIAAGVASFDILQLTFAPFPNSTNLTSVFHTLSYEI